MHKVFLEWEGLDGFDFRVPSKLLLLVSDFRVPSKLRLLVSALGLLQWEGGMVLITPFDAFDCPLSLSPPSYASWYAL